MTNRPITVALLAMPGVTAATLYGFHDCFCRRAPRLVDAARRPRRVAVPLDSRKPRWPAGRGRERRADRAGRIVRDVRLARRRVRDRHRGAARRAPRRPRTTPRSTGCASATRRARSSASSCSGAVLLARTGLLEGLDATSHWAYCDALRRDYPGTRWFPERGLLFAGAGQRIVMAGSGIAWHQLVMALISRFAGAEAAMQVARINLIDCERPARSPMRRCAMARSRATRRSQRRRPGPRKTTSTRPRWRGWSRSRGLPERTFKRRFEQATGMGPLDYVHHLRLEEAKQMLESGDAADRVDRGRGRLRDASFFNRLFRRKVMMSPAQYRRRFGALRAQLRGAGGAIADGSARDPQRHDRLSH